MLKRAFDIILGSIFLVVLIVPGIIIAAWVKFTSEGPILFWSERVGKDNRLFYMPKFRSMYIGTPIVATHKLADADYMVTPVGKFLRQTSLDELPQLYSILSGKMSFVGPRPALFNQDDLIKLRTECNVHTLKPGLTGWAQINGRDHISIEGKVDLDRYYLENMSLMLDFKIILLTSIYVLKRSGISH
ncbi:sugar transferase [Maritalea sp. S77]|uniref:sugar transferase n=1 Tax=Maritalea sp. S77 TaxID=3415125 RepID=UPI003C7A3D45